MAIIDTQQETADEIVRETGIPYANITFRVIREDDRHYVIGCVDGKEIGRKFFVPLATNTGGFRVKKASDARKAYGFDSVY